MPWRSGSAGGSIERGAPKSSAALRGAGRQFPHRRVRCSWLAIDRRAPSASGAQQVSTGALPRDGEIFPCPGAGKYFPTAPSGRRSNSVKQRIPVRTDACESSTATSRGHDIRPQSPPSFLLLGLVPTTDRSSPSAICLRARPDPTDLLNSAPIGSAHRRSRFSGATQWPMASSGRASGAEPPRDC